MFHTAAPTEINEFAAIGMPFPAVDFPNHISGDNFAFGYLGGRHLENNDLFEACENSDGERMAYRGSTQFDESFDADRILGSFRPGASRHEDFDDLLREVHALDSFHDKRDSWERCNRRFVIDPHEVQGVQEVYEMLGCGTFSEVYRCSFKGSEEQPIQVALKLFDQYVRLEDTEAELMKDLQHPHLVGLHVAINGLPCGLALELCVGGTLQMFIHGPKKEDNRQSYGVRSRLHAAQGVASALEYLHGFGLIHRDVKPGNCFLTDHAQNGIIPAVKLGDLGFAREVSGALMTRFRGTIRYMAPEVIESHTYGLSADIYSFGISLHELLSTMVPYSDLVGRNEGQLAMAIVGGRKPSLDVFANYIASAEITNTLVSCWTTPGDRSSASSLISQIEQLLSIA